MADEPYRVLALDGGGIRGLIPARVLQEIEEHMHRPISEIFDLIAGTSTGGIIALGLTAPDEHDRPRYTAEQMCGLYLNDGPTIFPHSIFRDVTTLHGLTDARYPSAPIEAVLKRHFDDTMLSQALADVVIPSYDLTKPEPYFFKTEYTHDPEDPWDVSMALAARATSAAPTYFDPAVLPAAGGVADHALVDGGTFANNPALSGYVDALRLRKNPDRPIVVVSIGTGLPPQVPGSGPIPIAADVARDFGLVRWARPILEVVLDGVPKATEYEMNAIMTASQGAVRYHRLQSDLPTASHALDDASPGNLARLLADAEKLIADSGPGLDAIYADLG